MSVRERQSDSLGYRVALTGVKGILRILIYICLIVFMIYFGQRAYALGREVFHQVPVDTGEGRKVTVTVTDSMSVYDIGRMLRAEGLLDESATAFWVQEFISGYHNQLLPGTYTLRTSMTADDMIPILAQDAEDGTGSI